MSMITSYCQIDDQAIRMNGTIIYSYDSAVEQPFLKQVYQSLMLEYPKFYKMDRLAQAGFIASELLKKYNFELTGFEDDQVALLFANSESSVDTDVKFEDSYAQLRTPSPSLFVYTLPNILMGEIAIRNKWFGENLFCVFSAPDYDFYLQYSQLLLAKGAKIVVCGWVDVQKGLDVKMFLVTTPHDAAKGVALTVENMRRIFAN